MDTAPSRLSNRFDNGMSDLIDFSSGLQGSIGRPLVPNTVPQEIIEDLEVGHLEGPLLLTGSPPTRSLSVPSADSEGTVYMADIHPPPPAMPAVDPEPASAKAEDIDLLVSSTIDQQMVNQATINDVMATRLTSAADGHAEADKSRYNPCRRSARLGLRPTAPTVKSVNKVRFRTRTKPKGKVTAKRGGRVKCPNGCLKTFSRTQDAHRHANETMQCRGGGERKSYPCMQCSKVFTRSDALRRHCSPRDDNPPACKVMRN
ncbi:hypothetical protein PILCRDRAFT_825874 [Piloderma croceum F 1598]|uniref:C2H2-type domain-containing protein n=1 Tax=Piloderma croceum (strain F 1598) TaxID=765440 RepID=A0A0C3ASG9_PILCF|nr:hypothetical protein PILCRDRAFT_825874 [Piloderma croceum F 1598]